ncbi:MAG: FAD:protein FMN transferase [Defluviitaleaceae bacterium]|nr:FAD:protein FMN transferase [Defluviitaleaceae bacterium]
MTKFLSLFLIIGILMFSGCNNGNGINDGVGNDNAADVTPVVEPTDNPTVQELQRFQHLSIGIMDTVIQIIGYAASQELFDERLEIMMSEFRRMNALFEFFNPVEGLENLYTINSQAGIAPVAVDQLIIQMLQYGISAYHYTNGAFNIALGPVLQIWHEQRMSENPAVPSAEELMQASMLTNIENVIIDERASTVFLAEEGMRLDVGGIAKGFAVEHIAQLGRSLGFSSLLVSAGGDSRMLNGPPGIGTWGNGLQNPNSPGDMTDLIDVVRVENMAVLTSGNYQRFFEVDGVRYHHLIDPTTLMPASVHTAVTVLHENTVMAEILTTALFIKDIAEGEALLERLGGHALWVLADGTIHVSEGYSHFSDNF